jgi:hypothetical protein
MTKKAMILARAALGSDDVWVHLPMRLGNEGKAEIYMSIDFEEPKGVLEYRISSNGGRSTVRLSVNGQEDEFQMPRTGSSSFKVASSTRVPDWASTLRRYGEAAIPMIAKVAKFESGNEGVAEWATEQGMDEELSEKVASICRPMIKKAKKLRFEHGDRVRIIGPDMDFGELGWVLGKPRKNKNKVRLFAVIVDGSSDPREIPEKWLKPNDVGRISEHV